ncbi:GNAT family N-acetyltransferase [Vibrio algarum]|uniref:GNAT family N-acetyltransferase n=1 Tax=Vibrio algarum TaxID=3020714 RepID=A0ABT4YW12_9VIBR|nr:GNAT family N-acetyltransferase [Vibrio sp. KJ40-1]MDB1125765.1 GNAT family N-acetyltransferase [Vibrio sp. KJ40-1]
MEKAELIKCTSDPLFIDELERLFQAKWSDFRFKDTYSDGVDLPLVIVAVVGSKVVGGLAYSRFKEPHQSSEVIWINAVYVREEWRGKGIASKLIRCGVRQVPHQIQDQLYVYTNVAPLYISLGWSVVDIESEPNHNVMSISLKPESHV